MSTSVLTGPVVVDLLSSVLQKDDEKLLEHEMVGGLILFSRNYETKDQLRYLIECVRKIRPEILIMVDQEGGRVQRFRNEFLALPALQEIGSCYSQDNQKGLLLAYNHGWLMATELLSVGVDMSLAPVLDMDSCFSDVIGDRSFSSHPHDVIALAGAYIKGMNDAGMCATAKHFPGHGAVKLDSHKALPVDLRSLDEIELSDMLPFTKLSEQYAAVMPAHIRFPAVDSNLVGYSPYWIQKVLREKLGFNGVVFSDDLSMEGAAIAGDYCARADAAIAGGCDAVLVCNHPHESVKVVRHLAEKNHPLNSVLHQLKATQYKEALDAVSSQKWLTRLASLEELNS